MDSLSRSKGLARVEILGAGAFGSALAKCVANGGVEVHIRDKDFTSQSLLLAGLQEADLILIATPSQTLRSVCQALVSCFDPHQAFPAILSSCKGIENGTLELPSQIMSHELPVGAPFGTLSGPSFAEELRQGLVTSVVVASQSPSFLSLCERLLHRDAFRIYRSTDLIGVELGGALKNVIAMAAGAVDGLGLGNNARAAVITRGLQEIAQIGAKMGANPMTFLGLSGLGDLILTCTGDMSRNRQFGYRCAQGETTAQIVESMGQVVEGVTTSKAAAELSQRLGLDTPILRAVDTVVQGQQTMEKAFQRLMARPQKGEFSWAQTP